MLTFVKRLSRSTIMKRSRSSSPWIMQTEEKHGLVSQICLEPEEEKLTTLLNEAIQNGAFSERKVDVRYAGGWVRDKLLAKPSHDIDIAISSMSGHEFAVQFAQYLTSKHPDLKTGSITKILANPEKSKHLDTATSRFLHLDLDFVQLRTESYGSDKSRTPTVVDVGTLEEDAQRRDCTMNALYFNVQTRCIEDPTTRGLCDLSNGLIQTPLAPRKTFLDDPLRILRCIRFSSQFGFSIEGQTFSEMQTHEVRVALKDKVVKERIGIEVLKMMQGLDPPKALRALHSQALYPIVFQDMIPEKTISPQPQFEQVERAIKVLGEDEKLLRLFDQYRADGRLWLIIALLPFAHDMSKLKKHPELEEPFASVVIRNNLKLTGAHEQLTKAVFPPRSVYVDADTSTLDLGRLVRSLGKDWLLALFVTFVLDKHLSIAETAETLVRIIDRIHSLGQERAWAFKSFIGGNTIKPLLLEYGADIKVMKELLELVVEYKIEDNSITEPQALEKLRRHLEMHHRKT